MPLRTAGCAIATRTPRTATGSPPRCLTRCDQPRLVGVGGMARKSAGRAFLYGVVPAPRQVEKPAAGEGIGLGANRVGDSTSLFQGGRPAVPKGVRPSATGEE